MSSPSSYLTPHENTLPILVPEPTSNQENIAPPLGLPFMPGRLVPIKEDFEEMSREIEVVCSSGFGQGTRVGQRASRGRRRRDTHPYRMALGTLRERQQRDRFFHLPIGRQFREVGRHARHGLVSYVSEEHQSDWSRGESCDNNSSDDFPAGTAGGYGLGFSHDNLVGPASPGSWLSR